MRLIVLIMAALQIGLFAVLAIGSIPSETGNLDGGLAMLSIALVGLIFAAFLIPAVILALQRRRLKIALVLAVIPLILYLILIGPRGF